MTDDPVGKYEVQAMIAIAIDKHDAKQEERHKENSRRLDSIIAEQRTVSETLIANKSAQQERAKVNRIMVTLAAAVGSGIMGLIVELVKHAIGAH